MSDNKDDDIDRLEAKMQTVFVNEAHLGGLHYLDDPAPAKSRVTRDAVPAGAPTGAQIQLQLLEISQQLKEIASHMKEGPSEQFVKTAAACCSAAVRYTDDGNG